MSILFAATALLAAVAVAIGLSLNSAHPKQVPFEAAKALATLATGLLLGGVLKLITDNHAQRKRDQAEVDARFGALIDDMHGTHDRLETTRLLIAANRSAKTYGDRMRDVIDAHVVLLKVARNPGLGVLAPTRDDADCLEWMLAYLLALQTEFQQHYKAVSNLQRYDEAVTSNRFAAASRDGGTTPPHASQLAWDLLQSETQFPVLEDLCGRYEQYETRFLGSCGTLAVRLRAAKLTTRAATALPTPDHSWPSDTELRKAVPEKAAAISQRCACLARNRTETAPKLA